MAEIVKIDKSKENEDVLQKAQLGDMIEFKRGTYSHWAIYVGKSRLFLNKSLYFIIILHRQWLCDSSMG